MKKLLLIIAKVLGVGLLLIVLTVAAATGWLKWSGDRQWKKAQQELSAKGEKLTFAEFIPPQPPDSENFFADPIWMQLADSVPEKQQLAAGVEYELWVPRLPANERLINQWNTPLTEAEGVQVKSLLAQNDDKEPADRRMAIKLLNGELSKTSDPVRGTKIAQTILDLIQPAASFLSKIAALSERPAAEFPLRYQDGITMGIPHLAELLKIAQLYQARINAELILGNAPAAATDIDVLLRICKMKSNDPLLISFMAKLSILEIALKPIDQGIVNHRWTDAQLADYQVSTQSDKLIESLCYSLRGERAVFNSLSFSKQASAMLGLRYPDYIEWNLLMNHSKGAHLLITQLALDRLEKPNTDGINKTTAVFSRWVNELQSNLLKSCLYPLEEMALSSTEYTVEKTIETKTQLEQTLVACALERYRIAHGSYPMTLELLIPEYLAAIPNAPTTGKPMNYSLQQDGAFLLWAPGWNLKSLGGKTGNSYADGDIVWNQWRTSVFKK